MAADDLRRFCRLRETKRRTESFETAERQTEGNASNIQEERLSEKLESSESVEGLDSVVHYNSSSTMTELSLNDLTMAEQAASEKDAGISRLKKEKSELRMQNSSLKKSE
jgi:hypothetical protein